MDTFPDEIFLSIFQHLSLSELLNLRLSSSYFNSLISDEYLWFELFKRDFYIHEYDNEITYYKEYKEVYTFLQSGLTLKKKEKRESIWRYYIHTNPLYTFSNGKTLLFHTNFKLSKLLLSTLSPDAREAYCLLRTSSGNTALHHAITVEKTQLLLTNVKDLEA
jgi:hypothetical protein